MGRGDVKPGAPAVRHALDTLGYAVLEGVADAAWLARLRQAFEDSVPAAGAPAARAESGTRHTANLLTRSERDFEAVAAHPRVLAAVEHVLRRPFRVLQLGGRDPLPGFGLQGLHTDWLPRSGHEPYAVVTAIWLLDDFTARNGATRVVPGSHLVPRALPKSMQAPGARHPSQVVVEARAGSVLVFNGHLWHGGTLNEESGPRRVLQCQYVARDAAGPLGTS